MPIPLLAAKIIAMLETLTGLQGGFLVRTAIRALQALIVSQLDKINSWAIKLTNKEKLPEGVTALREFMKEEIKGELPWWFGIMRPLSLGRCTPGRVADKICDAILKHKDELIGAAAAVEKPIEVPAAKA